MSKDCTLNLPSGEGQEPEVKVLSEQEYLRFAREIWQSMSPAERENRVHQNPPPDVLFRFIP